MALHYWSVEVRHGWFSAERWRESHGESLFEMAVTHGARDWDWVEQPWGLVFEVGFRDPEGWLRFRALPGVQAVLDAVPDPINGLYVYPGRGGSSGAPLPLHPRLPMGAGAAPLPETPEPIIVAGRSPAQ